MARELSDDVKSNLERIKQNIEDSYEYFKDNYRRYREYKQFVFKSTLSDNQRNILQTLERPMNEFNICEAYVDRWLGEFAKHEPSIEVSSSDGTHAPDELIKLIEGHIRHVIYESDKESFSYEVYKDCLAGGFSAAKVYTDYESPMSFKQRLCLERVFDPTLVGFDPLARASHKGDGNYSFELYPMTEEDFKLQFPGRDSELNYVRSDSSAEFEGFCWSYKNGRNQKILLVADYYEKRKKSIKIVQLANGRVIPLKDYDKLKQYWESQQFIEQMPVIVGKPRKTIVEKVCRYRLIEDEILEYTETDYSYLPHVFFDGNSALITQGTNNTQFQMTKPCIYNAKGIQDMTNFAGQTICNAMENLVQSKHIIMKEALPQERDYLDNLTNIQRASTIVVNAFCDNDPDKPIPNPIMPVQNQPLPPEVSQAFQLASPMTQTILGGFGSNLGKDDNDLSGKAIIESASIGNAAAMPYIVGYLAGLNQVGIILVDLMPKYLTGKRSISVVDKRGDKSYSAINQPGELWLNWEEQTFKVNISPGVNFQVQKTQAMEVIAKLMQVSQEFNQFMNSDDGLPILLDNLTCYGADRLKEAADNWLKRKQQMQQQAQQQQQEMMRNNPQMLRAQAELQKVQFEQQQTQVENQLDIARLAMEKEVADAKILESEAKINQAQIDSAVKLEESNTSLHRHALDSAAKLAEIQSRKHGDNLATAQLHHQIAQANKDLQQ